ncbi:MAG: hypothetical protein V3U96_07490 [Paracoccaceae bacterium]
MPSAPEHPKHEPYIGYFATIVLALISSGWIAGFLVDQFAALVSLAAPAVWKINLAAGLFLGLAAANPVGVLLERRKGRLPLARFVLGFGIGLAVQVLVLTPYVGNAMSNFMLILLASLAVPYNIFAKWARLKIPVMDDVPLGRVGHRLAKILHSSDRVIFIVLMSCSFAGFWIYTNTGAQVLVVLGVVLTSLVIYVARKEVDEEYYEDLVEVNHQVWLEMDPEVVESDPVRDAYLRIKRIAFGLLPGAVLFAGVTKLSVYFLTLVYPNISLDMADPETALQGFGILLASGVATLLFGLIAALGTCILVLRVVGAFKRWPASHMRDVYLQIVSLMYFRPIGHYWN